MSVKDERVKRLALAASGLLASIPERRLDRLHGGCLVPLEVLHELHEALEELYPGVLNITRTTR